jgi:hypothetical protein
MPYQAVGVFGSKILQRLLHLQSRAEQWIRHWLRIAGLGLPGRRHPRKLGRVLADSQVDRDVELAADFRRVVQVVLVEGDGAVGDGDVARVEVKGGHFNADNPAELLSRVVHDHGDVAPDCGLAQDQADFALRHAVKIHLLVLGAFRREHLQSIGRYYWLWSFFSFIYLLYGRRSITDKCRLTSGALQPLSFSFRLRLPPFHPCIIFDWERNRGRR